MTATKAEILRMRKLCQTIISKSEKLFGLTMDTFDPDSHNKPDDITDFSDGLVEAAKALDSVLGRELGLAPHYQQKSQPVERQCK